MSDTTKYLLTHFYGIDKTDQQLTEPIHYELQLYQDKSSINSISFANDTNSTNEESCTQQSLEANSASNSDEVNGKILTSCSWRVIEDDEEINDEECNSKDEDSIPNDQNIGELLDIDARTSLSVKSTLPVVLENLHDSPRARPSVTTIEDPYLDTLSDVSVRSTKKTKRKSLIPRETSSIPALRPTPLPSSSIKVPVYNKLYCDMSNSLIETLSIDIFDNFHDIRMLYLENNHLQELPDELFTTLKSLQWLDVRNNQLKTLPPTIKNHKCLETILLQQNYFERLPLELCLIPSLKSIHLAHNPLVFPSIEVRALGFKVMMDCLREEWNKEHPDEVVTSPEETQSVMTISCQQSSEKFKRLKSSEYSRKRSKIANNLSVRERSKNYKPSNRYELFYSEKNKFEQQLCDLLCKKCLNKLKIKNNHVNDACSDEKNFVESRKKDVTVFANLDNLEHLNKNITGRKETKQKADVKKLTLAEEIKRMEDVQFKERVYNVMTNNRIFTKIRPMRCQDYEDKKLYEEKFSKMCRLRDNLIRQNKVLQKTKDKNALKDWRQNRRSFEKSMKKANERNQQAPYATDDFDDQLNNYVKHIYTSDINHKMSNITESLQHLHIQSNKELLDPMKERYRLDSSIRKLKSLKKEIELLKNQNEKSLILYEGNQPIKNKEHKSLLPIII